MPKFEVTFQTVIEVTRIYEDCEDEDQAREYARMDAEDGQIGGFHDRQPIGGDVMSSRQI